MKRILGILAIAMAGGLAALAVYHWAGKEKVRTVYIQQESLPVQQVNYLPAMGMDFTQAAEKTVNAVVHIRTEYERKSSYYDYFFDFRDFFSTPQPRSRSSRPIVATGSGVIVSPEGYIVTNNHVVAEADAIEVTLNDKRSYQARIVGTDPTTDLALIKVDGKELPFVIYGNSDQVKVGEWVLAVGNPFNLNSTVTAGIVSAKARNINILANPEGTSIESFIQTDAAVNRGNSGGALVNVAGELVGINAAIASNTGSYTGYSFAIPVNIVRKVVDDLLEFGVVQRGFLGVSIRELDSKFAEEKGLKDMKGIFINGITANGGAEKAGLKEGDVILKVNGFDVNHTSELLERVGQHRPGDKVNLLVRRGNKEQAFDVTLRNQENTTNTVARQNKEVLKSLGATLVPVDQAIAQRLGIKHGVSVTKLEKGKLSEAGIREGFIILSIDNRPVKTPEDIENILSGRSGGVLLEGVYPNGIRAYYGFGLR
ncbi:MAG: Do family serine endopeptidase [Lentimicrobiaceae bacterium]|nr:Do family serine endopeptidase [Lentimicrobiaceae bacterium]